MAVMKDLKITNYHGEAKVFDCIEQNLPNDIICYFNREVKGDQFDFCLLVKPIGLVIIEVKGWNAENIHVSNPDEISEKYNGTTSKHTSPKKQAFRYSKALISIYKEYYKINPLVMDMVCYPFISEIDYKKCGLNIVSEPEYTLFKEDIEDKTKFYSKITGVFKKEYYLPHDEMVGKVYEKCRLHFETEESINGSVSQMSNANCVELSQPIVQSTVQTSIPCIYYTGSSSKAKPSLFKQFILHFTKFIANQIVALIAILLVEIALIYNQLICAGMLNGSLYTNFSTIQSILLVVGIVALIVFVFQTIYSRGGTLVYILVSLPIWFCIIILVLMAYAFLPWPVIAKVDAYLPNISELATVIDQTTPHYAQELNEIPENYITELDEQAQDAQLAYIAQNWRNVDSYQGMRLIGKYLLVAKNPKTNKEAKNKLFLVYEAIAQNVDEGYSFYYYYYTCFNDIYVNSDGTCKTDLQNYNIPRENKYGQFAAETFTVGNYYYLGYQSLDDLYSGCIMANADKYTHEGNCSIY